MNRSTLAADAASATEAIAQMATHAAEQAVRGTHRFAEDANHLAHQGSDAAIHSADLLRAQADQWQRSARSYIEHEPVKATLMAMAAGAALVMLVGLMTRGRHGTR
jgi:hypothetical protein